MIPTLDKNSAQPLYVQLEAIIRENIKKGVWLPNQRIPSENEFSKQYDVSRMTVRSVITNLVNSNLLYRVQGKGTFVYQPKIVTKSPAYMGVREQLEEMGYEITTKLLIKEKRVPSQRIQKALNIGKSESVFYIERLRMMQDKPISLHSSYIPCILAPTILQKDLENEQLCVILENTYGLKAHFMQETLETVSSSHENTKTFSIKRGYPLLLLEEIISTSSNQVFEYASITFRGDLIKLKFNYISKH